MRRDQLIAEAIGGNPNTFITLTSKRVPGQTPDQAAVALAHAWRNVRRKAMKLQPTKTLPFIAVFEATKLGWPHLHILCRVGWIYQKWLSEQMDIEIGAPIVDIRRISDRAAIAGYVAKYIGKNPHRFSASKRYWKSKDYDQRKPFHHQDQNTFTRRTIALSEWITECQVSGWFAWRKSPTEAWACRPP